MPVSRLALSLLMMVLLAPAWAGAQDSVADLRIDWAKFKKAYDENSVVVVDVRSADAFEAGHIPRAVSVPLDEVERRAAELQKLGKPIVLYCA
jgi:rhodanese-related sulfurtransferase